MPVGFGADRRQAARAVTVAALAGAVILASAHSVFGQEPVKRPLGRDVPVIDSADFLRDPESYLRWLCSYAGVPFTDTMLSWRAGPRPSDGIWAPYWYDAVLHSTGFQPYRPRRVELTPEGDRVVAATRPAYERLYDARLVL